MDGFEQCSSTLSEEQMEQINQDADQEEIERLLKMGVLLPYNGQLSEDGEEPLVLQTRHVYDWRQRTNEANEKVWFRRSRLVAKELRCKDPLMEGLFSPTPSNAAFRLVVQGQAGIFTQRAIFQMPIYRYHKDALQWSCFQAKPMCLAICCQANGPGKCCICTHVDDLLIIGSEAEVKTAIKFLRSIFKLKVQGPFNQIGDSYTYLKRHVCLQEKGIMVEADCKHVNSLIEQLDLQHVRGRSTPLPNNHTNEDTSELLDFKYKAVFQSATGRLMYLVGDRPDLMYAVRYLSSKMSSPTRTAWSTLIHVVCYVKKHPRVAILLPWTFCGRHPMDNQDIPHPTSESNLDFLCIYSDSDWASMKGHRRSISGNCMYMNGVSITTASRTQRSRALSSCEAELLSAVSALQEGMMIRQLWTQMTGRDCKLTLYMDSSSARAILQRQGPGRLKHIEIAYLWTQQAVKDKLVYIKPVSTYYNPADLFTKSFDCRRLYELLYLNFLANPDGDYTRLGEIEFGSLIKKLQFKTQLKELGDAWTPLRIRTLDVFQEMLALSVEGVFQMVYIPPERLLALVRPAFDLVLRRIRSLKRCVQA